MQKRKYKNSLNKKLQRLLTNDIVFTKYFKYASEILGKQMFYLQKFAKTHVHVRPRKKCDYFFLQKSENL